MFRLIKILFQFGPHLIFCYFKWMLPMYKHPERYPLALRFYKVQKLIRRLVYLLKIDMRFEEEVNPYENKKKFIMFCNHQSMFDALAMIAVAKRPVAFLAKKETETFPFVGKALSIIGGLYLNREDIKSQVKIILKIQNSLKDNVCDWVVFPEGTRNKNPENDLLEFHSGTFKIPQKSGADLYYASLFGSFRALQFLKYKKNNLPLQFVIFDKISNEELQNFQTTDVSKVAWEKINLKTNELREKDKELTRKLKIS